MSDKPYTIEMYEDRETWLQHRGIGGSDAAAITGHNTYTSPLDLWAEKTGRMKRDPRPTIAMRAGHALEDLVAEEIEVLTGLKLLDPGDYTVFRSRDRPWQTATIDRFCRAYPVVEMKTSSAAAERWEPGGDLYTNAEVQVQHNLSVVDGGRGLLGVCINLREVKVYEIEIVPVFVEEMLSAEKLFLEACMEGMPPEAAQAGLETLKQLHPYARHRELKASEELAKMLLNITELRAEARAVQIEIDEAVTAAQLAIMNEAGIGDEGQEAPILVQLPRKAVANTPLEGKVWKWSLQHREGYTVKPGKVSRFQGVKA